MDTKALAAIAAEARKADAERLGLTVTQFAAVAPKLPPLPRKPEWFDMKGGQLAVSPDCSYQLVAQSLRRAKSTLLLYIYDISAGYLFDELSAAKDRGVDVRVMYDATQGGKAEEAELKRRKLTHIAAPSSPPARVFTVCHQKFAIIDDKGILVESANWASTSIPERPKNAKYKLGNREWVMWAPGKELAGWFKALFDSDWQRAKTGGHAVGAVAPPQVAEEIEAAMHVFAAVPPTQFDVEAVPDAARVFPLISPNNYKDDLRPRLADAKKSICVQQQYIWAGDGVNDLLAILEAKQKKGVKVRIITSPKFPEAWDRTVKTLKAANLLPCLKAQNLEFVVHCHNKGVIIDDTFSVVSSTNWSENSVTRGREAGLLIESKKATAYFQKVFDFDWKVGVKPADVAEKFAVMPVGEGF